MINLITAIGNRLMVQIPGIPVVKSALMTSETKSVAVRLAPSAPGSRYINRKKIEAPLIQVLAKSTNDAEVLGWMGQIETALELSNDELSVTGYDFIKCEVSTSTNFVEQTQNKEYVYTALFQCELIKGGN